ncbi:DEDD exonuclease domain-containing protein [Gordonia sp. HY002]|uniref:DEDD exonuclease domain-containing protein n=1 Tax=Gordonia zhenghanii TaxID=2911516 RepID=UPI001EF1304E|nr:DEDD exonuclease domain-containing protein [Gordonia zhenghanii]MCF8570810.1 DEDD exonuclease domain-containing protein [Gordonia zhenghanii]MCF8603756.1 DEDD exonuclease domain-containing protein [Gordonia zhenghanii]
MTGVQVPTGGQLSFADLDDDEFADRSLFETTLVVVDLETTGGSSDADVITEIGAVKIRGGEVLGEFATLVDPGREIPPQIVALTGITTAMTYDAPPIEEVLPAFAEFARGSVLVAHNARFDIAFLRKAAGRMNLPWPFTTSLCTVAMARRILTREEAPSVKLSALAELFDVSVRPTHRALDDARATVDVFHRLLERVGNRGVHTYRDLTEYLPRATPAMRAKRSMASGLPRRPGVYLFRGPGDEVLYVGTAVDLRRRVASYFSGGDTRARIGEMVSLAERVEHVECAHDLEAGVRELTLLAAHKPSYNRRSRNAHRGWWINLSRERFPRLSVSRSPAPDAIGPVHSRTVAADIADVISAASGLRSCTQSLRRADHHWCPGDESAVGLPDPLVARLPGLCHAASDRPQTLPDYLCRVEAARALMAGRSDVLLTDLYRRLQYLADSRRFESAARARDRLSSTVDALARCQRLAAVARIRELVVARPDGTGGWNVSVVRYGRLAGAAHAQRGVAPVPVIETTVAAAKTVLAPEDDGPLGGAPAEEVALVQRWIAEPGARLVSTTEPLESPIGSAQRWTEFSLAARRARDEPGPAPARVGA